MANEFAFETSFVAVSHLILVIIEKNWDVTFSIKRENSIKYEKTVVSRNDRDGSDSGRKWVS